MTDWEEVAQTWKAEHRKAADKARARSKEISALRKRIEKLTGQDSLARRKQQMNRAKLAVARHPRDGCPYVGRELAWQAVRMSGGLVGGREWALEKYREWRARVMEKLTEGAGEKLGGPSPPARLGG